MHNNPTTQRARQLRHDANPAEKSLWHALKGRQCGGYKFTRQFPIGPYFTDFACRQQFLCIELDGGQHVGSVYDGQRDAYLLGEGYSVLRIPSATVLHDREAVCETIHAALQGRLEDTSSLDLQYKKSIERPRRFTRHRQWAITHPQPPPSEGGE